MDDFMNELGRIIGLTLRDQAEAIKATQKTVYKVAFLLGGMLYLLHDTRKRQSALRDRVYALEKKAKAFDQALEYKEEDA